MAAKKLTAIPTSIPSPIGGWNARDSIGAMPPMDAVELINWWPLTTDVMVRQGQSNHVTGIGNQVESLMVYNGANTSKMFCASGTSFFEVTSAGAVGAAVQTLLSNARWQYQNISTSGGNYMYCVNGLDKPRFYDGTTWVAVDAVSTPAITGVTTTLLSNVNLFKNRLWFVEKNTLRVWYLPTSSIGGAASQIDLSSIARRGGYLVSMGTWTIDAGTGVDDLLVFFTSQGEIIVYQGTDPSTTTTWSLVGVWQLGSPIGVRNNIKFEGDILCISQDGVLPLAGALQSSRVDPRVALTDKIQYAMSNAATLYGSNFGWQLLYFPKANMLILNIPVSTGSQEQYVMNTITKAWARFQGWSANCWDIFNDEIYFGGNGVVCKAWTTFADNSTAISTSGRQAFNYFGKPGLLKRWTMMRPILRTDSPPSVLAYVNVDFDDTANTTSLTTASNPYGTWDTAIWDTSVFGGGLQIQKAWQGAAGIGYCASPVLKSQTNGIEAHWVSTDLVMEVGGVL